MAYFSGSLTSSSMFLILLFSVLCFSSTRCYALNDQDDQAAVPPPYPPGSVVIGAPPYPPGSSIRGVCKDTVYYDLCVASLESVPRSFTVSWDVLPFISLQLSLKNITDTNGYIKQLLNVGGSITLKDSLKHCEESYGLAIQSVKTSMEQYQNQRFRNLIKNVNYARSNVTGCEQEIKKNPDLSRSLSQKNTLSYQLLTVSYDLGKQLVFDHDA